MRKQAGISALESLLVLAIILIVFVGALPQMLQLTERGEEIRRDAIAGAVRFGVTGAWMANVIRGEGGAYPTILDHHKQGPCKKCFSSVLSEGVTDDHWRKVDVYRYEYDGGTWLAQYVYNPERGTFE